MYSAKCSNIKMSNDVISGGNNSHWKALLKHYYIIGKLRLDTYEELYYCHLPQIIEQRYQHVPVKKDDKQHQ